MKKLYYSLFLVTAIAFGFFAKADATMPMPSLTATATSPTAITLNWTVSTSTGAVSYHVYKNSTSTPIATTSLLTYSDAGLTPLTSYTYYLTAFDNLGNYSNTNSISTTTLKDEAAPTIPLNLIGSAISNSQINLNWSNSTDNVAVAGYKIYRNGGQIATSGVNSFSDINLTASTTYTYAVNAFDAANNLSGLSTSTNITTLKINPIPTTSPVFSIELFNCGHNDIKTVNYISNQKIRIVLYSDNVFNADTVDTASVSLSGAKPVSWTVRNVNKDIIKDFIFDFRSKDLKDILNGTSTILFQVSTRNGQNVQKEFKLRVKNSPFKKKIKIINKIEDKIKDTVKKMEDKADSLKNKLEKKINAGGNNIHNLLINGNQQSNYSQKNNQNHGKKDNKPDNKSKSEKGRNK